MFVFLWNMRMNTPPLSQIPTRHTPPGAPLIFSLSIYLECAQLKLPCLNHKCLSRRSLASLGQSVEIKGHVCFLWGNALTFFYEQLSGAWLEWLMQRAKVSAWAVDFFSNVMSEIRALNIIFCWEKQHLHKQSCFHLHAITFAYHLFASLGNCKYNSEYPCICTELLTSLNHNDILAGNYI